MKNYKGILEDLLALTVEVSAALDRGDIQTAKSFTDAIREGLEINIK